MSVAETIKNKLMESLDPVAIDVIDESHMHAGHAGARPEGESHFRVEIISAVFEGKSRVDRQRMVYAALAKEMAGPIHALALKTMSPSEGTQ